MFTGTDIRHYLANIRAVLDYGIAALHCLDRKLVPDGYVAGRLEFNLYILIHDPAGQFVSSLYALDHDYTDTVTLVMHNKIYHLNPLDIQNLSAISELRNILYAIKHIVK